MAIVRNLDAYPIIVVELQGRVSVSDLDEHFAAMEIALRRGKILTINDTRLASVSSFSILERHRAARGYAKIEEKFGANFLLGEAFIFANPIVKGIVTAIHWLSPSHWPIKHFRDLEPALAWARSIVADAAAAAPKDRSQVDPPL